MTDRLPPDVISKPDALEKYNKPERTFQRRLSKALRVRSEAFLSHFYLATSDGVVRPGMEVAEGAENRETHGAETYLFCSSGCAEKFRSNPERYLAGGPAKTAE